MPRISDRITKEKISSYEMGIFSRNNLWNLFLLVIVAISIAEGYYITILTQRNNDLQEMVITKETEISNLNEALALNKGVSVRLDGSQYSEKNAVLTITN